MFSGKAALLCNSIVGLHQYVTSQQSILTYEVHFSCRFHSYFMFLSQDKIIKWCCIGRKESYVITIPERYGQTDGRTTCSAGLTMVQVVHLNRGLRNPGPHNFTEIIFIHAKYIKI